MNALKKLAVSLVTAVVVALSVTLVSHASSFFVVSESSLYWVRGSTSAPIKISNSGCYGSTCRYLYQGSDAWRWAYTGANAYYWYVWDPNPGQAAVYYRWLTYDSSHNIHDNWLITVDQSAHHGSWVYLGFSDYYPNAYGELRLGDDCVPGYTCGGLKVYWDNMEYSNGP